MNLLTLKKIYLALLPNQVRVGFGKLRLKDRILIRWFVKRNNRIVQKLKKKNIIQVAFIAMDVSFWKYDGIFRLMQQHKKFSPRILLIPRPDLEAQLKETAIKKMKRFFDERGFPYETNPSNFRPDILFYAQPYKSSIPESMSIYNLPQTLFCYVPYAFWISNYQWGYDQVLHNIAWKLFYPTEIHKNTARSLALNKGANVSITGYPLADSFLFSPLETSPWPEKSKRMKKIIWAPHHSVLPNKYSDCSSFLSYADEFIKIAEQNQDRLWIAFKPHPILKHNLYQHPDWGQKKTDAYFKKWETMPNTFIADGNYVDLFKTSDALIHDCGSFMAEYLYTKKPCMYIGNPRDGVLCDFGKMALNAHYTENDFSVRHFIQSVLFDGKDPKYPIRDSIYKKHLLPPNGKSAAQNILADILNSFGEKC